MADDPRSSAACFPAPPVAIHGVPFDNVTLPEAADAILQLVKVRVPQYALCADSGLLLRSREDTELRRVLAEASLVLAASNAIRLASRLFGNALAERIAPGALSHVLLQRVADRKLKVCLLGASEAVLTETRRTHPALSLRSSPAPLAADDSKLLPELKRMQPDLLLFSTSKLDVTKWITAHCRELEIPVCLGLPRGSDRGFDALRLLFSLVPQFWQLRFQTRDRGTRTVSAPVHAELDWRSIKLPERLDLEAVNNDVLLLDQLLADGRHCLLDMSGVRFIDSTGIGHLVRLHKRIRGTSRQLVLLAPSDETRRTLKLVNLEEFFAMAESEAAARALIQARTQVEAATVVSSFSGRAGALVWRGEVTATNAESVWVATADLVRGVTPARGRFEVDLSQLRFVDSSGLSIMVRARKLALERGLHLRFVSPPDSVRDTVRRGGLEQYLFGDGA
jgi:anti-anti-sigma factor